MAAEGDMNAMEISEDMSDEKPDAASLLPSTEDEGGDLPADFERLWNVAHDNPQDFTSWTDLLQYCEQEGHMGASQRSLMAFLNRYPLCYGYWKKIADLERRAGNNNKAAELCVQGLQSIPLSVDLWIHYINLLLGTLDMNLPESPKRIRSVFEDAVTAAGLDFHSDRLWDLYAEWEKEQGNLRNVTGVLDRVLRIPTQHYNAHYEKFKNHLNGNPPKEALSLEEYEEVRASCHESRKVERTEQAKDKGEERPPGEEEPTTPEGTDSEELMQRIREDVFSRRDEIYQQNELEVRKRWNFEENIKRPYFHVKPLDQLQLRGWHAYLDWEVAQLNQDTKNQEKDSNQAEPESNEETEATAPTLPETEDATVARDDHRVRVLFERCLIACALYEEFWTRYVRYLETDGVDEVRAVYRRACEIHLPSSPNIHIQRANFEERHGDLDAARRVLAALEEKMPGLVVVRLRRAALERRAGQLEQSEALLREAVTQSEEKPTLHAFYSIKLARLLLKLGRNPERARRVLREALERSPDNDKLHLNLLELELSADTCASAESVQRCVTQALAASLAPHTKILFSQRGLQFVEEYSDSIKNVLSVYDEHQKLLAEMRGTKREAEDGDKDSKKSNKGDDGSSDVTSAEVAADDAQVAAPPPPEMNADTSAQSGSYDNWYQQQQYGSYGYQNTWNYSQGYYPQS
ncbi:pre-mRNA-processing factor 39 [Stigmatopora nigra]